MRMAERRKKLIEVALPLEAINKESAREKSIRHGHPSTLHLWWARRPLAACRAVLFAQFVDDPDSDPAYRNADGSADEERAGLKRAQLFNLIEQLVVWKNSNNDRIINAARAEIARCVASRLIEEGKLTKSTIVHGKDEGNEHPGGPLSGEFRTAWELIFHGHGDLDALEQGKARLCPPEVVNHFLAAYAPPVLDPFAGGGSIPLEAQRLGLRAYASDLNPVPVLINKALIEIPPKFANQPPVNPETQKALGTATYRGAEGLAEDVRYYGKWMRDEAEKRIGHLYPKVAITEEMAADRPDLEQYVGQELTVIAWLWARTVPSPDPSMNGKHVPLVSSFWLSKKKGKEVYIHPSIDRAAGTYRFEVRTGKPTSDFDLSHVNAPPLASVPEPGKAFDPDEGTKTGRGCKFKCIVSETQIPEGHIKALAKAGDLDTTLLAVVCEGTRGRVYLSPTPEMEAVAKTASPTDYDGIKAPLADDPRNLWCLGYGLDTFDKLFTARQLTALVTFSDLVGEARARVLADATAAGHLPDDGRPLAEGGHGPQAYADAVATYLAFGVSKLADRASTISGWDSGYTKIRSTFGRQSLPMTWDFAEGNPFCSSTGNWSDNLEWGVKVLQVWIGKSAAHAHQANVTIDGTYAPFAVTQSDATAETTYAMYPIISCDPPYYDNIGYADLSDFFYVWLRRSLKGVYSQLLSTMLTPKSEEMIASPYRHDGSKAKAAAFFEEGLGSAIGQWRKHGCPEYPTTIFYAFKQAETDSAGTASTGWETFLEGVIGHNFAITGTWPMRTELSNRMVGTGTNALASSVVLACVPREADASMATRREFLNALKRELPEALRKLQSGNIAPVDLAQASIGPGMGVFSRYSKVVESDGEAMTVRAALTIINQMLDEVLAEQEGEFDGDTRWAVAWFEQYGVQEGPYGVAETLSKAKNMCAAE